MNPTPHQSTHRITRVACSSSMLMAAGSVVSAHAGIALLPPAWIVHEAGETIHAEMAAQVVMGPDGSITVLGTGILPSTFDDVLVIRYDANGNEQWLRRFDSPEHGSDIAGNIVAAPDGGVWFSTQHFLEDPRIAVTRLDAGGNVVWSESRAATPAPSIGIHKSQLVPCLAVDLAHGEPRIYVTVSEAGAYRVLRFDDTGAEAWDITLKSETPQAQRPTDIDVGVGGDVYVTGWIADMSTTIGGYGTIGLSPDGDVLWSHLQTGDIGSILTDPFVRAHPGGGAIVAGSPETGCGGFQMRVWSISDEGVERWDVTEGDGPCSTAGGPTALAVAPDGRIAVCASHITPGAPQSVPGWRTLALDADGAELWDRLWDNPDSAGEAPMAIAFDPHGGVVVTGMRQAVPTMDAFGIIRYDAAGEETWNWSTTNPTAGAGVSIAITADGPCFVTCRNWGGFGVGERIATMRFDLPQPPCPADFDGDGAIGGTDLAVVLGAWGSCSFSPCIGDLDHDGLIDGNDLAVILGAWGDCR